VHGVCGKGLPTGKPTRWLWAPWLISGCAPRWHSGAKRWARAGELNPIYRRLLKMTLQELQFIEQQISKLDQEIASLLSQHQDAVQRLAEVPGLGVDSAQQIIAEVGAAAATFPSAKHPSSWVGACPGDEESAGESKSHRSPKGNRHMRRMLNQCANAAIKTKGRIFEIVYRRLAPRLGHNQTIGAIAHRLCRLIWIILHPRVRYEERGPAVHERLKPRLSSRAAYCSTRVILTSSTVAMTSFTEDPSPVPRLTPKGRIPGEQML
jgi:hypothetical protein